HGGRPPGGAHGQAQADRPHRPRGRRAGAAARGGRGQVLLEQSVLAAGRLRVLRGLRPGVTAPALASRSPVTLRITRACAATLSAMQSQEQVKAERRGGLLARLRPGDSGPADGFEGLQRKIKAESPKADLKEIQSAFALEEASHRGQKRLLGVEVIGYSIGVAIVMVDLGMYAP